MRLLKSMTRGMNKSESQRTLSVGFRALSGPSALGNCVRSSGGTSSFTLVELMAVIGIIALLAVVGVPAIRGLSGSGNRKSALSQLMGVLEIARNTAITSGTNTAVIFPNKFSDAFLGGEINPYRYRTMAIVKWPSSSNSSSVPTMTKEGWIPLPQGISFVPASLHSLPTVSNVSFRLLTNSSRGDFSSVVFQADGSIAEDYYSTNLTTKGIAFFEGTVAGPDGFTINWANPRMSNVETITFLRYTGRVIPTLRPTNSF